MYLCGRFISWSPEHTRRAGFSACLCHFPCCSSEAIWALVGLAWRRISPLCSSRPVAQCGRVLAMTLGRCAHHPHPTASILIHSFTHLRYTHILYILMEVLRFAWNERLAKDLSTEKSRGNDILGSLVCVRAHLCVCVCAHKMKPGQPPPSKCSSATQQILPRLICFMVKELIKYLKYGVLFLGIRCNALP